MADDSADYSRMDMNRCAGALGIELLNQTNYEVWKTCMESYLVGEDLWDVVDGNDVQSPEANSGNLDALKKWKQLNAKAEFALKRTISRSLFDHIMGCKSAHEIWRVLHSLLNKSNNEAQSETIQNNLENATPDGDHARHSRALYVAAVKGDWKAVESIFENDPDAVTTAKITLKGETTLHVAIDFGQTKFAEKLVALMPQESLEIQEHKFKYTVLHYAVTSRSLSIVKTLVNKHDKLTQMVDRFGRTPLHYAAFIFQSKEIVRYLALKIPPESPPTTSPFFADPSGGNLMSRLVSSRSYDICLHLLERYPFLSVVQRKNNDGMLPSLTYNPFDFPSGSKLAFWERCIYQFIPVESLHEQQHSFSRGDLEDPRAQALPLQSMSVFLTQVMHSINGAFWTIFCSLVPRIKCIKDEKCNHRCTKKMVEIACEQISSRKEEEIISFFTVEWRILRVAALHGVAELIAICLQHFPYLLHISGFDILEAAISNRKEKVFNLFLGIKGMANPVAVITHSKTGNTLLHHVAKLAPYPQLSSISCPALQMQRELQWYKAVEMLVSPVQRTDRNKKGESPREIFTTEHRELLKDAEKWMKDTSNSCMVVSTLIATVVFAATFTVPGGNVDSKGIPLFLEEKVFMLFAISDAMALFSSTTSILMFLSILTARFAEDDFLCALPKRLIIGFASLFIAIATMMVAFGATLYMVLSERFWWVFIPIIAITSIPVALFIMLQLPLFIFMVNSTYGLGIFHPIEIW